MYYMLNNLKVVQTGYLRLVGSNNKLFIMLLKRDKYLKNITTINDNTSISGHWFDSYLSSTIYYIEKFIRYTGIILNGTIWISLSKCFKFYFLFMRSH